MLDAPHRLLDPDLPERLSRLGFRREDAVDATRAAERVVQDRAASGVQVLADRLRGVIGGLLTEGAQDPWDCPAARDTRYGVGVLPMLALIATVPEVQAYHASRGISEDLSWRALSDLGQQAWVHRRTFGEFGLHTFGWMQVAWGGGFFWLGRLQFNLVRERGVLMLSTHIPQTGPLTPESVDASMTEAAAFFGTHFSDLPATAFHCASWLLDPQLADALPAVSNMARFQRRWSLYGEPLPGDEDAIFFTFARRGPVEWDSLPQDTTLQRVIVDRLRAGGHWQVWNGTASGANPPTGLRRTRTR